MQKQTAYILHESCFHLMITLSHSYVIVGHNPQLKFTSPANNPTDRHTNLRIKEPRECCEAKRSDRCFTHQSMTTPHRDTGTQLGLHTRDRESDRETATSKGKNFYTILVWPKFVVFLVSILKRTM